MNIVPKRLPTALCGTREDLTCAVLETRALRGIGETGPRLSLPNGELLTHLQVAERALVAIDGGGFPNLAQWLIETPMAVLGELPKDPQEVAEVADLMRQQRARPFGYILPGVV